MYDDTELKKRALARKAARFISVMGITPGDPIPAELREMREQIEAYEDSMKMILEHYPKVQP